MHFGDGSRMCKTETNGASQISLFESGLEKASGHLEIRSDKGWHAKLLLEGLKGGKSC